MNPNRYLCAVAGAAALAACGGPPSASPDFLANAPSYDTLSLQMSDADAQPAAPEAPPPGTQSQALTIDAQSPALTVGCGGLFARSHDIVARVNRHFNKVLRRIKGQIAANPRLASGQTHTWESVENGIDTKFTMTKTVNANGSVSFNYEMDMKQVGAANFSVIFTGNLTRSGPSAPADGGTPSAPIDVSGSVTFDFDALHGVVPTETASGKITDTFDNLVDPVKGKKRSATMTLTNFVPEEGDPHGPRTGSYVWLGEPGIGGSFEFNDTVVLLCPANPSNLPAEVTAVARWYKASDGALHGRTDAKAVGGQIGAGQTWMGVTCAQGATTTTPAEGYWMQKLENADGTTAQGTVAATGTAPCDLALGATVPDLNGRTNDFAFPTSFSAPYPFPNMW